MINRKLKFYTALFGTLISMQIEGQRPMLIDMDMNGPTYKRIEKKDRIALANNLENLGCNRNFSYNIVFNPSCVAGNIGKYIEILPIHAQLKAYRNIIQLYERVGIPEESVVHHDSVNTCICDDICDEILDILKTKGYRCIKIFYDKFKNILFLVELKLSYQRFYTAM